MASIFRRRTAIPAAKTPIRSGESSAGVRVEFTDLAPEPVVFLGQSAYLFLRYAESAARHAHDAVDLETESTLALVAEECFVRFSRLAAILERSNNDRVEAMSPFIAPTREFERRTRGRNWVERVACTWVTMAFLQDFWRQLAAGLKIELDAITESYEREPAPEPFEIAAGHIPRGGVAAVRFQINGIVDGHPAIVVEHVTRLRGDLRPDWAQPAQPGGSYRVEITGEPSYAVDICPTSRFGDHNHAAIAGAAARIVNAIPAVIAAPPGIRTTLDLPLVSDVGVYCAPR